MSMVTSSDNGSYARKLITAAGVDLEIAKDTTIPDDRRQVLCQMAIGHALLAIAVVIVDVNEEEKMYDEE